MLKPIMTNLVQKSISAAANQLSCANGCDTSRHIQGNGKRKGMFHSLPWFKPHSSCCTYWAWIRSWTVSWSAQGMRRIVLTVLCPKQLHVSEYNTLWWHILKLLKPDQGLDKLPTTQSLVRTHPSPTGPGIAILCIKCNYHWLCVLTLVIFGTIAQFDADKTVSVARAPAWTLAGGFNVIGPTHASNELKNLPHEHVLPWLAMTVACHLALSSTREMAEMTWLTSRNCGHTTMCGLLCGARWLSGRMPDSQSREPGFESPLIPFRSLGIFFHFTTPQSTQLYKWVPGYRQWWKCEWIVVAQLLHG